jgi:GNAT superfamily N-acetyltransferase
MKNHNAQEEPFERSRGSFLINTDRSKLDMAVVRGFLARSYWAEKRPAAVIERSIAHSLCFGMYRIEDTGGGPGRLEPQSIRQVGLARVITDRATFAYLCDVFIAEDVRGEGLGKWLIETILAHPDLQGLRRWMLATADAHGLYRQFGFSELAAPERWMEIYTPQSE